MNAPVDKKTTQKKAAPKPTGHSRIGLAGLSILTLFTILSLATYHHTDPSLVFDTTHPLRTANLLGYLGAHWSALLLYFFGLSALLIPITMLYCIRIMLFNLTWQRERDRLIALPLFLFVATAICHTYSCELFLGVHAGGWFGGMVTALLAQFFTPVNAELFLFTISWGLGIIIARFSSISYLYPVGDLLSRIPVQDWLNSVNRSLKAFGARVSSYLPASSTDDPLLSTTMTMPEYHHQSEPALSTPPSSIGSEPAWNPATTTQLQPAQEINLESIDELPEPSPDSPYVLPPLSLFPVHKEAAHDQAVHTDGEQRAHTLEQKLDRFGIKGKVVKITHGPAVMLFEYQPSIDTKISTILAREDDLALALQAMSLRIMAPIPGRSVIGFEVAHNKRKPVFFSQQLKSTAWINCTSPLPLVLGKDTLGLDVVIDLATMPHLLVAGSTGSGKSVGLHTMVMSLLCSKSPDEVKFILIDPKRLEFAAYADIPHLVFPIVTDPRRAIAALKWAVEMMEDRYALMAQAGVRNLAEFNSKLQPQDEAYLPLIVIIIDELADLMMTAGKEVEQSIARLAQMARAAGIHLIAATQRPSVDVITGLIKVNFPSRIAYKVTSKVDSRTILDVMGAEKLLGKGDMLFLDTKGAIHRVHGAYVTDAEIQAVVAHVKAQRTVSYQELISFKNEAAASDDSDELFEEVINYIKNKDEISISLVQRVFRIGYNRSARIMDQLESYGYILPADGGKMRKVSKET